MRSPADDDHLVPLAGGRNFRDLGGYLSRDGRAVRRQRLYRSGSLAALTSDDVGQLAPLGIQVVCDLRTPPERAREPSVRGMAREHRDWDHNTSHGLLRAAASAAGATPQQVHDALAATYEAMPWIHAEMYSAVFHHLVAGELPLVFHCAGGKDRTGVLAALILTALEVPEDQVMADYLLTDRCLDTEALVAAPRTVVGPAGVADIDFLRAMSPALRAPLLKCHPDLLRGALRAIAVRHGSVLGYIDAVLGVDRSGVAQLRHHLLEPPA